MRLIVTTEIEEKLHELYKKYDGGIFYPSVGDFIEIIDWNGKDVWCGCNKDEFYDDPNQPSFTRLFNFEPKADAEFTNWLSGNFRKFKFESIFKH